MDKLRRFVLMTGSENTMNTARKKNGRNTSEVSRSLARSHEKIVVVLQVGVRHQVQQRLWEVMRSRHKMMSAAALRVSLEVQRLTALQDPDQELHGAGG